MALLARILAYQERALTPLDIHLIFNFCDMMTSTKSKGKSLQSKLTHALAARS